MSGWQSPGSWEPEPASSPDTDDDWSTPYGSGKVNSGKTTTFDSNEWDDWVDEEPEEVQGLSPTGTEYVGHLLGGSPPPSSSSGPQSMLIAAALSLVLGFSGFYLYRSRTASSTPDTGTQTTEASESEIWLQSARQSMADKDYELAAAQWQKSVDLLKLSKADPKQLEDATRNLATALTKSGELERAHEALISLKVAPRDELQSLERSLRVKANASLESARKKAADSTDAQNDAKLALKYYEKYGGSKAQRAGALEIIGKTYIAQQNSSAAAMSLRRSLDLEYTSERASLLSSLSLPTQRPTVVSERPRPVERPAFQLTTGQKNVPQGERPAAKYPTVQTQLQNSSAANQATQAEEQPQVRIDTSSEQPAQQPARPPLTYPAENGGDQDNHSSSKQDVLPSYHTGRGQNQRPPGY